MPRRYLISRLSALGDVVCSLPAAVAIKKHDSEAEITWIVDPRFAGVVDCCWAVDTVVRWKPSWKNIPAWPDRFDAAIDLQGLLKSALGIARAKAEVKVAYHWQREGAGFFASKVLPDPSSFHIVDQYVDVVRSLGIEADRADFGLAPSAKALESITEKLRAKELEGPYVVLNAGAGWATKRWPPESFAALIDSLTLPAVLIGGKAEADRAAAAEVIQAAHRKPIDLLGQTSVPELIALISQAQCHVGGDTGSTHIAAALGIPAVGLYSITRPQRSCPYGQIECCHYNPDGLRHIAPSDVLETVRKVIPA